MLLIWRLRLRAKLRVAKQAKVAQRYLLLRRYFRAWEVKVGRRRREGKLKEFQLRATKKLFDRECLYRKASRHGPHVRFRMA